MNIFLLIVIIVLIGVILLMYKIMKRLRFVRKRASEKDGVYKGYYDLCNQWINNLHRKEYIHNYLNAKGYKSIAIYGMGEIGKRIFEELEESGFGFNCCFIDKAAKYPYADNVRLFSLRDISNELVIDVIIVTPVYAYESIESELKKKNLNADIVSIKDIIFNEQ